MCFVVTSTDGPDQELRLSVEVELTEISVKVKLTESSMQVEIAEVKTISRPSLK